MPGRGDHPPSVAPLKHRSVCAALLLLLLAGLLYGGERAPASPLVEAIRADVGWLAGGTSRALGTSGHDRIVERLADAIDLPGVETWEQTFALNVPVTESASLSLAPESGGALPLHPLWPAGVRLHATPPEGIGGELVYVGPGDPASLPIDRIGGRIAVMEMAGGENWRTLFGLGAKAVVLLGSDEVTQRDAATHLFPIPAFFPRFYCPEGDAAERLRTSRGLTATIRSRVAWQPRTARTLFALVGGGEDEPEPALCIAVPLDSMSVVPDLAPGADNALDIATALAMLRRFADDPPQRPVLFAFVDGYTIRQSGMREMLMAYGLLPQTRRSLGEKERQLLPEYVAAAEAAETLEATGDPVGEFHRGTYQELRRYIKEEVQKQVLRIDAELHPLRLSLFRLRREAETSSGAAGRLEDAEARVAELEERRGRLYLTEKQLTQDIPLDESGHAQAARLWARARERIDAQLARVRGLVERDEAREAMRLELLDRLGYAGADPELRARLRPVSFVLGLDLSDAGSLAGPMLRDYLHGVQERSSGQDFTRWLRIRERETGAILPERFRPAVNLRPVTSDDAPASFVAGVLPSVTGACQSFGVPGLTWATLDGERLRRDTPRDRPERLDWTRLGPQIEATVTLLESWVRDPAFAVQKTPTTNVLRIRGMIADQAAGEPVARVPMEDYLVTLMQGGASMQSTAEGPRIFPALVGMREQEFIRTGADGIFVFDALAGEVAGGWFDQVVQAYRLDEAGRVIRTINQRKRGEGAEYQFKLSAGADDLRAVVFSCVEHQGLEFFDPRFLMALPQATLLHARSGTPKAMSFALYDGMMVFHLEPAVPWQILLRSGIVGNRMALVNSLPVDEGRGRPIRDTLRGFETWEGLPAHPQHVSARDFYRLDARRLEDYRKAGVVSEPIEALQEVTAASLGEAEAARASGDGEAYFRHVGAALANEVRAYRAVQNTAADVVRGAIFLLLVLVPFSYAAERLLFASPHIYRQLLGGVAIFGVMTAVLWSFHPAFRMSSMPLMIIMAFAILFMSFMVIWVVYRKFETELDVIRSGMAEAAAARTSRFGVVSTAFRLGIANMRKRKFRTLLTGLTVMLITFALLAFMSASTYVGRTEARVSAHAERPAVLVRMPGDMPLTPRALLYLRTAIGASRTVAPRYWWYNQNWYDADRAEWRAHVTRAETGAQISLLGGLGLGPEEARVSGADRILPAWARFARGEGCYLPEGQARRLGAAPGETLLVAGHELELLGTYDPNAVDEALRRLDGGRLFPPDPTALVEAEAVAARRDEFEEVEMRMATGTFGDIGGVPPVSSGDAVILPSGTLRGLNTYTLRSLAVPAADAADARTLANELAGKLAFPIYYASEDGVRVVATRPLAPRAPKSLLIPLVIAGMIIFNTMLSSLAERRREIYIYTSLGLAPLHIGVLFLGEAVTYGLLGSIFGYVVGQGLATVFTGLGWMGSMTLNFGGTQAILTMLLVLGVVVVSSLIPAWLAGRVAAPSNEMKWGVPEPEPGADAPLIRDRLPFTATAKTAPGIVAFLKDFFDAHRSGAVGHFTTAEQTPVRLEEAGRGGVGIVSTVWLAPYDLGIRQEVRIAILDLPGEEEVHEILIALRLGSGQAGSWHHLNRTFLGGLRRQLLGWHKLPPERVLEYIEEGRGLLADAPVTRMDDHGVEA